MSKAIPYEHQSHLCDGQRADGWACQQMVRNDSDHCEAGHHNKFRALPGTKLAIPADSDVKVGPASFEIDEVPATRPSECTYILWCPNGCGDVLRDKEFDGELVAFCPTCQEIIEPNAPLKIASRTIRQLAPPPHSPPITTR